MNPTPDMREAERPYVLINMAMTADGKITSGNRAVSAFGSRHDHEHLLALRATADAVMAGARTVDGAAINLGPGPARFRKRRLRRGLAEYNLRVIVSGAGSIHPGAHVFTKRFSPILILTTDHAPAAARRRLQGLANAVIVCGHNQLNLRRALRLLRTRWGVQRLLCEGGGALNDALFRADLVDELHLTICPLVFGGRGALTVSEGVGFAHLDSATQLRLESLKRRDDELFLVFRRSACRLDAAKCALPRNARGAIADQRGD